MDRLATISCFHSLIGKEKGKTERGERGRCCSKAAASAKTLCAQVGFRSQRGRDERSGGRFLFHPDVEQSFSSSGLEDGRVAATRSLGYCGWKKRAWTCWCRSSPEGTSTKRRTVSQAAWGQDGAYCLTSNTEEQHKKHLKNMLN